MTLGEAADFTSKPRGLNVKSFEKVPFVPMELVAQGGTYVRDWVWKPGKDINSGNYFEKGDCLMARITPCFENGKQGIARELPADFGYASTELIPFRGRAGLSNKYFLFYFVLESGVRRQITQKMEGATGRQRIPMSVLKHWPIMLPSLPEQKKIAAVLLKIQRAIETQDRMIQSLRDLKKSTMQHLFTHGLRGEKTKMTDIGEIPESWDVVPLGNIAEIKGGKRLPRGKQLTVRRTPYPYIRVTDFQNNSVQVGQLLFVPEDIQPAIARYIIKKNDIYISIAGTTGVVGIIPEDLDGAQLTENAARIVLQSRSAMQRFVMHFLASSAGQQQVANLTTKTSQPKLALARIKLIKIALPQTREEQNEIASAVNGIDFEIGSLEARKILFQSLFKTTLNKLMSGKLRVADLDIDMKEVGE